MKEVPAELLSVIRDLRHQQQQIKVTIDELVNVAVSLSGDYGVSAMESALEPGRPRAPSDAELVAAWEATFTFPMPASAIRTFWRRLATEDQTDGGRFDPQSGEGI